MNIKVDLKKLFAAVVSAIMCLSAGGCYLLPDEEEVLDAPTVKASDVTYSTVTAKKKDDSRHRHCHSGKSVYSFL